MDTSFLPETVWDGAPLSTARRAVVLLHGRGATAHDLLPLGRALVPDDVALVAPQATNRTWYPASFLAPFAHNEPHLSQSLAALDGLRDQLTAAGLTDDRISWLGFSQGSCLLLEYCARHARRWGALVAFSGGLPGPQLAADRYAGHFAGTPVFLGSSDPDPHVPPDRVRQTGALLTTMGAQVTLKIYPGRGHTVHADEMAHARRMLLP